jgi:hypothetical protein
LPTPILKAELTKRVDSVFLLKFFKFY